MGETLVQRRQHAVHGGADHGACGGIGHGGKQLAAVGKGQTRAGQGLVHALQGQCGGEIRHLRVACRQIQNLIGGEGGKAPHLLKSAVHGGADHGTRGLVGHGGQKLAAVGKARAGGLVHQGHQHCHQPVELGLAAGQKVPGVGQGAAAVVELGPGVGKLLFGLLVLGKAVLVLRQTLLIGSHTVLVRFDRILIFEDALGVVLLAVVQLDLGVNELLFAVGDLLFRVGYLPAEGLLGVTKLPPAVIQLRPGIGELRPGIIEFLLRLGLGVSQFLLRLGELFVGLVHQALPAELGPLLTQGFQGVGGVLHQIGVAVIEGGLGRRIRHLQVDGGIVIHGEGLLRQVDVGRHLAGAQGGGAPLHTDVEGAGDGAHDGEAALRQGVLIVPLGLESQRVPHGKAQGSQDIPIHGALRRCFRQPPGIHLQLVQPPGQGVDLGHDVHPLRGGEGVDDIGGLPVLDLRPGQQDVQVVFREAQSREHL